MNMKKRILSLVLMLSMLLSLLPAFAMTANAAGTDSASGGGATSSSLETYTSFTDYYVQDGLIALFDASDLTGTAVSLSAGTWTAKTYDTTIFTEAPVATIVGGAYSETNKTGWYFTEDGLGYNDPSYLAGGNMISFGTDLLKDTYTVDIVGSVTLRELDMPYTECTAANGKLTVFAGVYTATAPKLLKVGDAFKVSVSGTAGQKITVTVDGVAYTATVGDDGTAIVEGTVSAQTATLKIKTPVGVTVTKVEVPNYKEYLADASEAFAFGSLFAYIHTNKVASNSAGEGLGNVRWYTRDEAFAGNSSTAGYLAYKSSFAQNDGKVTNLVVSKGLNDAGKTVYTVQHGTDVGSITMSRAFADHTFHILKGVSGTVHTVRVYNRALTDADKSQNAFADKMICAGISFEDYNALPQELKDECAALINPIGLADIDKIRTAVNNVIDYYKNESDIRTKNEYDKMYVQDGLIALYTAYADDMRSLSVMRGLWYSKVATPVGNSSEYFDIDIVSNTRMTNGGWEYGSFGGVQGRYSYDNWLKGRNTADGHSYLGLNTELLNRQAFTVETVLTRAFSSVSTTDDTPYETTANYGNYPSAYNTHYIGALTGVANTTNRAGYVNVTSREAWLVSTMTNGAYDCLGGDDAFNLRDQLPGSTGHHTVTYRYGLSDGEVYSMAYTYGSSVRADSTTATGYSGTATYHIRYNITGLDLAVNMDASQGYIAPNAGYFRLMTDLAGTVYAIRVYEKELSTAELLHNRLIDLAAYCGADLTLYNSLSPENKALLENGLSATAFAPFAADLEEKIAIQAERLTQVFDAENSLYVTDGLSVLLTAYENMNSGVEVGGSSIAWYNAVNTKEFATLKGSGWTLTSNGGFNIVKNLAQWNLENTFGLYLDSSMIPEANYTVELVTNPVGISDTDDEGNLIRYIDTETRYGINRNGGFVIGPLRNLQFYSYDTALTSPNLEKRWMYSEIYNAWNTDLFAGMYWDKSWEALDLYQTVTFTITLDKQADGSLLYDFINDFETVTDGTPQLITAEKIADLAARTPADQRDLNKFQLMVGVAGTIYACRVYDRVLSRTEMLQNHLADLIYYYDIDPSMVMSILGAIEDPAFVYESFAEIGFKTDREGGQQLIEGRLVAIWLKYNGYAVRGDTNDGLRHYFDLDIDAVNSMVSTGFYVEVGAIVNIGDGKGAPELEDYGYDYRIHAYDSDAGFRDGFFMDEDTYAVTVWYKNADKKALLTDINVRGYVKLVSADGDEAVLYCEPTDDAPDDLFSGYHTLLVEKESDSIMTNDKLYDHIFEQVERCYEEVYVHVDASAADGGDGSEEAPYNNIETAFAACKEIMKTLSAPTYLYLKAEDGTYKVHNTLSLAAEDMPYRYTYFSMLAEGGNALLTSTKDISTASFTQSGTDNIYVYQFEPDADGNYPAFRDLYVNDQMAIYSHNGATQARYATEAFVTAFDRTYNRVEGEDAIAAGKVYLDLAMVTDLSGLVAEGTTRLFAYADKQIADAQAAVNNITASVAAANASISALEAQYKALLAEYKAASEADKPAVKEKIDAVNDEIATLQTTINDLNALKSAASSEYTAAVNYANVVKDPALTVRHALTLYKIEMHVAAQWNYNIIHLTGVDFDDRVDTVVNGRDATFVACYLNLDEYKSFSIPSGYTFAGRNVHVKNLLNYVDTENEFYYDEDSGKIYYYSEAGLEGKTFSYPTLEHMIWLDETKDVEIDGFSFTGLDDDFLDTHGNTSSQGGRDMRFGKFGDRAAIYAKNVNGLTVRNCRFYDLPGNAIHTISWTENFTVKNSSFENIGGSAINVGANMTNEWKEGVIGNENINITNNYLNNIATTYKANPAIYMNSTKDAVLQSNTIFNTSYTAISAGWSWGEATWERGEGVNLDNVEICYNYITNFMTELGDGGAIYILGGNATINYTEYMNFMHHNYIVFSNVTGDGQGHMCVGIYFDQGSSHWLCSNNVVVEQSYGAASTESSSSLDTLYLTQLRARRNHSHYFYTQHISLTYRILYENNYLLNVRALTPAQQLYEAYKGYLNASHYTEERGTRYITDISRIPANVENIIYETGCEDYMGDPSLLYDNNY